MPPRIVVGAVLLGWLLLNGWFISNQWFPWWRTEERPPFAVELADEVAPLHSSWIIYRKDQKIGTGETRMAPKTDGTFELSTRLRDLDLPAGIASAKLPLLWTTSIVNRDGELQSLDAKCNMIFNVLGNEIKVDAHIRGRVEGEQFVGECNLDTPFGPKSEPLTPIPLTSKNAFSPLQPLQKYPALKPGQTWKVSAVDPASEALAAAVRQVGNRLLEEAFPNGKAPLKFPTTKSVPQDLLAEVQADTTTITHRGKSYTCRVIVFRADEVKARTWVDVTDGKVIRQEALGMGESIIMQRE